MVASIKLPVAHPDTRALFIYLDLPSSRDPNQNLRLTISPPLLPLSSGRREHHTKNLTMFTVLPTPAFSFGLDAFSSPPPPPSIYRPVVPSPLSSLPIRASSVSPPPRTASDFSTFNLRDTQSSPLTARHQQDSRFKYATRNAKPNPVVKRREDAQEGRRKLFLQNVRQRAEDQKWEKRGGDNEVYLLSCPGPAGPVLGGLDANATISRSSSSSSGGDSTASFNRLRSQTSRDFCG